LGNHKQELSIAAMETLYRVSGFSGLGRNWIYGRSFIIENLFRNLPRGRDHTMVVVYIISVYLH
jgi:hypothetical protein